LIIHALGGRFVSDRITLKTRRSVANVTLW